MNIFCVDISQSSASTHCYHLPRPIAIVCIDTLLSSATTHWHRLRLRCLATHWWTVFIETSLFFALTDSSGLHRHNVMACVDRLLRSASSHMAFGCIYTLHLAIVYSNALQSNVPTHCYHLRRHIAIICFDGWLTSISTHCYHLPRHIAAVCVDTLPPSASRHCCHLRRRRDTFYVNTL